MRHIFTSIIAAALTYSAAAAQSLTWGYYNGTQDLASWGTGKAETYSVAMVVNDASFVGSSITALRIPVTTPELTNCAVFLSHEMPSQKSGVATGDILNQSYTPSAEDVFTTVTLDEPWTVDSPSFYVGFTFKVASVNTNTEANPIIVAYGSNDGAFEVVTSRTYRKWQDMGSSLGVSSAIQLVLEGDLIKQTAVGVSSMPGIKVRHDDSRTFKATLANHGQTPVTDVDWTYTVADATVEGHTEVSIHADYYGELADIDITTPVLAELGSYTGTLIITKVNGVANQDNAPALSHTLQVVNVVPVKRPLMEEFTGTWCGWCPRGWMGLKLMNEWHPGDFIAASYHNGDGMQITEHYPVSVPGFPAANMDRHHNTDAYYGDGSAPMGIENLWLRACSEDTPANVSVSASYDADLTSFEAKATFEFCEPVDASAYGVAYIVTADGLADPLWIQHSYYHGEESERDGYLDYFIDGPEYMSLVFDDVVIYESHESGACYTGVFPASVAEGESVDHTENFTLARMNSNYQGSANLVQDKDRLSVIALLIDTADGRVLNCAKCHVEGASVAIENLTADAPSRQQFNLMGQPVQRQHGMMVQGGHVIYQK